MMRCEYRLGGICTHPVRNAHNIHRCLYDRMAEQFCSFFSPETRR